MRVLVIEPAGQLWGSERALIDLIESVADIEIAVCCPPDTPLIAELWKRNVRVVPDFIAELHRKSRWQRLRASFGVWRACLSFRPDVVHVNQAGAYRVTALAARLLGIPVVCHVRLFEDAAYLAARKSDPAHLKAIIAISGAVESEIVSHPVLAAIPVRRIYDAYAPADLGDATRAANRMACVGRIVPIKGQEVLLAALALLPGEAECLIVGGGDSEYVAQLKARMPAELPVHIEWTGFVGDVAGLLRRCGVLACPSHREPLGRVIFEAWDAGTVPVVFAGSGGAAEVVAAADGGILYAEQTPECLAGALSAAMALDRAGRDRLVANGRAWMARHCAPKTYGAAVAAVFRAAAS